MVFEKPHDGRGWAKEAAARDAKARRAYRAGEPAGKIPSSPECAVSLACLLRLPLVLFLGVGSNLASVLKGLVCRVQGLGVRDWVWGLVFRCAKRRRRSG